ncbi:hypothetical protein ACROYT_G024244 [Oculina patagonica]
MFHLRRSVKFRQFSVNQTSSEVNEVSRDSTFNIRGASSREKNPLARALIMKYIVVAVWVCFLASFLAVGVDSAVSSSSTELSISAPIEEIWAALSRGHRYPIIRSGDTIALRSSIPSGSYSKYWLYCARTCAWYNTKSTIITSSGWSSWTSHMKFIITAFGKMRGEPIDSGDFVSLYGTGYGSSYRLRCTSSSSTKCEITSLTSSMTGSYWLYYSYATFQMYSYYAPDGTPVQYGDFVGFKYPYASNSAWLTWRSSYFYPRSCSSNSKSSCARENTWTGFQIFKKL